LDDDPTYTHPPELGGEPDGSATPVLLGQLDSGDLKNVNGNCDNGITQADIDSGTTPSSRRTLTTISTTTTLPADEHPVGSPDGKHYLFFLPAEMAAYYVGDRFNVAVQQFNIP
jgi:hypothetical protein